MSEFLSRSACFGVLISLIGYYIGVRLKKRFKFALLNPFLISLLFTIAALLLLKVDYESYYDGAKYLNYLLTPATVCLAIPLYEQLNALKKNFWAVFAGILAGVLAALTSIFLLALIFKLDHARYVTLLPKSITTAIGMVVSEEMGGYPGITTTAILFTGLTGNVFAEGFLKLIRVTEPVAKGIAMGTSAHAIGTSKAFEMGQTEGAMSSVAIAVAGIITVVLLQFYAGLI